MKQLYSFTKNKDRYNESTVIMSVKENPLTFIVKRRIENETKILYEGTDSLKAVSLYEKLINYR